MSSKNLRVGVAMAAVLACAGVARADVGTGDGVRFRGGIALEGGALIVPGATLGAIGPIGHLGVQINNLIGVYLMPGFDVLFGPAGGVNFNGPVIVDFTFLDNRLTLGIGPDFGFYAAAGVSSNGKQATGVAGVQYGARGRIAFNAIVGIGENGYRRKALVIALDLRALIGPAASATTNANGTSSGTASTTAFGFAPMLSIGYEAF